MWMHYIKGEAPACKNYIADAIALPDDRNLREQGNVFILLSMLLSDAFIHIG